MSKERAIALLGTAKQMESPEDIRSLIERALRLLETDGEPIQMLEISRDMIYTGLQKLHKNMPDWVDTPQEKAEKFAICESALGQIKEYASVGLKARTQGSLNTAEDLLKGHAQHNLQEFSDAEVEISVNGGEPVRTTVAGFERAAKLAEDPDAVNRILNGGA